MEREEKTAVRVLGGLACVVLAVFGLAGALYGFKPGPAYASTAGYHGGEGAT